MREEATMAGCNGTTANQLGTIIRDEASVKKIMSTHGYQRVLEEIAKQTTRFLSEENPLCHHLTGSGERVKGVARFLLDVTGYDNAIKHFHDSGVFVKEGDDIKGRGAKDFFSDGG